MTLSSVKFKIYKHVLKNGLTVLVKPVHQIPRVEAHLWYNVGSKDEAHGERGMAHLIEHMLFKGTKNLSESDINLICQKISADANAFTSQDYTCYTFRIPNHTWKIALEILADCMQNATFDSQMLSSELKAVIEELRLYKDDFQGCVLEKMLATLFPEHPYHNPIIGSKFDLCSLDRDKLYAFYKKHYHPANAVLVITGDVTVEEAFQTAELNFGHIPSPTDYKKETFYFQDDIATQATTLYRPVTSPWYCYVYRIPGLQAGQNHLIDIASLILASGKSSRLYQRLVNKEQVAVDVDCSVYDFFEKGLMCIGIWPTPDQSVEEIEAILADELEKVTENLVYDWEFLAAKKRTQVDFTSLLESVEKQAFVIGNAYVATQDEDFVERYLTAIDKTTKKELQRFFKDHFSITQQNKGYLLPITPEDLPKLVKIQTDSEKLEQVILERHERQSLVEPGRLVHQVNPVAVPTFSYPKPKTMMLENGLEVIYHHNPLVPQVVTLLSFKANHLYEPTEHSGAFGFLLRAMSDRTQEYDADEFAKMLETAGIHLGAGGDSIVLRCLSQDYPQALKILMQVLTTPSFDKQSIDKLRHHIMSELDELWDSPVDFIDQVVKELVYGDHPYHKNSLGNKESIQAIDKKILQALYKKFISPQGAVMVIVGDLSQVSLPELMREYLEPWEGPEIPDMAYPKIPEFTPQNIAIPLDRDQVVLGFVAPSVARTDADYNALAILDIVLTGGMVGAPTSRLFNLREQSGLFYVIGGSLIYGSREEPGMVFVKTIVASEKVEIAKKSILQAIDDVGKNGITIDEFNTAKNMLIASAVDLFESNIQMAQTFLFLKKLNLNFNLFDKQGEFLSILKIEKLNEIAQRYCNKDLMTVVQIGRIKKEDKSVGKKRRVQ